MTMVKASEAVPREAANSVCTIGSATTTDHMPTLPSEPIRTATAKRVHARRESGTNTVESRLRGEAISTAAATSSAAGFRSSAMARYWACRCSATGLGATRHDFGAVCSGEPKMQLQGIRGFGLRLGLLPQCQLSTL